LRTSCAFLAAALVLGVAVLAFPCFGAEDGKADIRPNTSVAASEEEGRTREAPEGLQKKALADPEDRELVKKRGGAPLRPKTPGLADLFRMLAILVIILALIVGTVFVLRRFMPQGVLGKPGVFFTVLATYNLTAKHTIYAVKSGTKILILGLTPQSISCLATLEPAQVADAPGQIANAFDTAFGHGDIGRGDGRGPTGAPRHYPESLQLAVWELKAPRIVLIRPSCCGASRKAGRRNAILVLRLIDRFDFFCIFTCFLARGMLS